jgi:hypothetical protein
VPASPSYFVSVFCPVTSKSLTVHGVCKTYELIRCGQNVTAFLLCVRRWIGKAKQDSDRGHKSVSLHTIELMVCSDVFLA